MSPFTFLNPWAFFALSSLVAVGLIYLFYQRYRPRKITALFLWDAEAAPTRGGRRLTSPRITRPFLLDLLAVLLLVIALSNPAIRIGERPNLVFIFDGSLSMRSNDVHLDVIAKAQSIMALRGTKEQGAIVLLAEETPRSISLKEGGYTKTLSAISGYLPSANGANLEASLKLAGDIARGQTEIHVFTDHAETLTAPPKSVMHQHTFSAHGGNIAILDALRRYNSSSNREELNVCIGNFSDEKTDIQLTLRETAGLINSENLTLEPNKTIVLKFMLPPKTPSIQLRIEGDNDSLKADSSTTLAPTPPPWITARSKCEDDNINAAVNNALLAAGAIIASENETADLIVTDDRTINELSEDIIKGDLFTLRFLTPTKKGESILVGPYVIDSTHPLCTDLTLEGVYWPCDKNALTQNPLLNKSAPSLQGVPLIIAGNIPLYGFIDDNTAVLNLTPGLSNLTRNVAWPVLFSNLVRMVKTRLPGLRKTNYLFGEGLQYVSTLSPKEPAHIMDNAGNVVLSLVAGGAPPLLNLAGGEYQVISTKDSQEDVRQITVMNIAPNESNLADLSTEDSTQILRGEGATKAHKEWLHLGWLFFLATMLVSMLNWLLDNKEAKAR